MQWDSQRLKVPHRLVLNLKFQMDPQRLFDPTIVIEHRSTVITNPAATGALTSPQQNLTGSTIPDLPIGLLESELPKYRRDLVGKLRALRSELQTLQPQSGHCRIEVSRSEIFEESHQLVMKMRPKDMREWVRLDLQLEFWINLNFLSDDWWWNFAEKKDSITGTFSR